MFKRFALIFGATSALLAWAPAVARAEENGLKVGDGRLHPYFDIETVYDTAAQLNINPDGSASGVGDFVLHFRPGLKLDVPSPTLAITLDGAVEYLVYTGLNSTTASQLNRLQAEANLDVGILRGSSVSFDLGDHFTRSNQTSDVGLPVGVLSFYNDARGVLTVAPGGGSLTISPGYHLLIEGFSPLLNVSDTFGSPALEDPSTLNYLQHRVTLENRWRFLPKTAILLDGEFDDRVYSVSGNPAAGGNQDIEFWKATTGVTGLVTPHFSTTLRVGWAMDITTHSFSSVIGQLEATYLPNETSQLRLGFLRNYEPVSGSFISYQDDRAYLQGRVTIASRLTLNAQVTLDYLGFNGTDGRNDLLFTAGGGADYEVTRWLILGVGDSFTTRSSSDKPTDADPLAAGLNLSSDQVYLRLTFTY